MSLQCEASWALSNSSKRSHVPEGATEEEPPASKRVSRSMEKNRAKKKKAAAATVAPAQKSWELTYKESEIVQVELLSLTGCGGVKVGPVILGVLPVDPIFTGKNRGTLFRLKMENLCYLVYLRRKGKTSDFGVNINGTEFPFNLRHWEEPKGPNKKPLEIFLPRHVDKETSLWDYCKVRGLTEGSVYVEEHYMPNVKEGMLFYNQATGALSRKDHSASGFVPASNLDMELTSGQLVLVRDDNAHFFLHKGNDFKGVIDLNDTMNIDVHPVTVLQVGKSGKPKSPDAATVLKNLERISWDQCSPELRADALDVLKRQLKTLRELSEDIVGLLAGSDMEDIAVLLSFSDQRGPPRMGEYIYLYRVAFGPFFYCYHYQDVPQGATVRWHGVRSDPRNPPIPFHVINSVEVDEAVQISLLGVVVVNVVPSSESPYEKGMSLFGGDCAAGRLSPSPNKLAPCGCVLQVLSDDSVLAFIWPLGMAKATAVNSLMQRNLATGLRLYKDEFVRELFSYLFQQKSVLIEQPRQLLSNKTLPHLITLVENFSMTVPGAKLMRKFRISLDMCNSFIRGLQSHPPIYLGNHPQLLQNPVLCWCLGFHGIESLLPMITNAFCRTGYGHGMLAGGNELTGLHLGQLEALESIKSSPDFFDRHALLAFTDVFLQRKRNKPMPAAAKAPILLRWHSDPISAAEESYNPVEVQVKENLWRFHFTKWLSRFATYSIDIKSYLADEIESAAAGAFSAFGSSSPLYFFLLKEISDAGINFDEDVDFDAPFVFLLDDDQMLKRNVRIQLKEKRFHILSSVLNDRFGHKKLFDLSRRRLKPIDAAFVRLMLEKSPRHDQVPLRKARKDFLLSMENGRLDLSSITAEFLLSVQDSPDFLDTFQKIFVNLPLFGTDNDDAIGINFLLYSSPCCYREPDRLRLEFLSSLKNGMDPETWFRTHLCAELAWFQQHKADLLKHVLLCKKKAHCRLRTIYVDDGLKKIGLFSPIMSLDLIDN